jgi:hypothetical protein
MEQAAARHLVAQASFLVRSAHMPLKVLSQVLSPMKQFVPSVQLVDMAQKSDLHQALAQGRSLVLQASMLYQVLHLLLHPLQLCAPLAQQEHRHHQML